MIKHALFKVAGTLGAWSIARRLTHSVPKIFMLHRFSPEPRPRTTHADELVRFIHRVSAECDLVTVRDLLTHCSKEQRSVRPLAAITVDDGYEDFYSVALPIFDELKVPATLFPTAGFVDRQCWMWWDALRYLIDVQPPGTLDVDVAGSRIAIEFDAQSSRDMIWSEIADLLVKENAARKQVIEQLEERANQKLPVEPTQEYTAMTWAQLREAEERGIEIGGHTMSHAFLPTLEANELQHEIAAAKSLIEQQLNQKLTTFAYPNGMPYDYTQRVIEQVRAAGFQAAVLAYAAPFDLRNPFKIGRWSAHSSSPQLDHILSGASEIKLRLQSW